MIAPMIHRLLRRDDLARLVAEIGRSDPDEARPAAAALEAGDVDGLLDSRAALEAVRGKGGAPAPLPLTLLWYVPVRAALRQRGLQDIALADYTATLPVAFAPARESARLARGRCGLADWWRAISALPSGTVAQAERAADIGALALWWAGCFPEAVARRGGASMVRAYITFASHALALAARAMCGRAPGVSAVFLDAAEQADVLWDALHDVRRDYVGPHAASAEGRLERFLNRRDH